MIFQTLNFGVHYETYALAELQQHIPDIWEQTVRYFGCYASRTRGAEARKKRLAESLKRQQELLPPPKTEPAPAPSKTWAACMKRVFEIDPLSCPRCNSEMRIVAFVQDQKAIKNIVESLGLVTWRAPPTFATSSLTFGRGSRNTSGMTHFSNCHSRNSATDRTTESPITATTRPAQHF